MENIIKILCLCLVAGLILFLIFRFVTDFKATLVLALIILVGNFIKTHFFGK
ncbi:hypothetical protein FC89_GL001485 [Liquorilactobacillus ghanensis DSM 18630]|jgi:hypothetical protein|uniref:Uncharacterized protein n=1 Tax=Liquorilactobacillus ghanensis DSM 18630 TaxID=1423750 RepID=A0A0R1VKE3_9LACO|nr:hypothetical protein FC89_GL001485 [Liquorilactobacillus ghanensis DSM 18630]